MITKGGIRIKRIYKGTGLVFQDPVATSMSLSNFNTSVKSGNGFYQNGAIYGSTYTGTLTIVGTGLTNASVLSTVSGGTISVTNKNATDTQYTAEVSMTVSGNSAVATFDMDGYMLVVSITNTPSTVSSMSLSGLDSVSGNGYNYTQSGTISDRTYTGTLTINGSNLVNTLTKTDTNCTTTFGTPSTNTTSKIVVPVTITMDSNVEQCSTVITIGNYTLTVTLDLLTTTISNITISGTDVTPGAAILLVDTDTYATTAQQITSTFVITGTGIPVYTNFNSYGWGNQPDGVVYGNELVARSATIVSSRITQNTSTSITINVTWKFVDNFRQLNYNPFIGITANWITNALNKQYGTSNEHVYLEDQYVLKSVPASGVYYHKTDGTVESTRSSSDNNGYDGVVVSDGAHAFVIGKNTPDYLRFGGYNKDLSNIGVVCTSTQSTALADFAGDANTTAIINALNGYNDGYSTGAPAAEWCRTQFNGKGYLPSLGEWKLAYDNKSAVDTAMSNIGGTAMANGYHWASTLYNASGYSWGLGWSDGAMSYGYRATGYYVRAFCAL